MIRSICCSLLFLLLATGCGHALRPDPVPISAVEANYPTAEFVACGSTWHGLGVCGVPAGKLYDDVKLSVQVYYKGVLAVDSKNCGISIRQEYASSGLVSIPLPGTARRNCVITMTVTPKYPNQDSQNIQIYSFRGHLALRVLTDQDNGWEQHIRKVTGSYSSQIWLWVGPVGNGRLVAAGCGRDSAYNQVKALQNGWMGFDLNEIMPAIEQPKVCVMEGFVRTSEFTDLDFDILVAKYDSRFTKLPVPRVQVSGGKITITADDAVSIVALDMGYVIDHKAEFKFDGSRQHVIRILTVKGRSAIGFWYPAEKKWRWLQ